MRVWLLCACALVVTGLVVARVAGGRTDAEDFEAADRICEPALLEDEVEDANEAEVLQIAVQAGAAPAGWIQGRLPGPRSDVRPVADATLDLLDAVTTSGEPPAEPTDVDRRRAVLARACDVYRR